MTIELRANGAANQGTHSREIATRSNLEPQSFAEVSKLAEYVARSGLFAVKTQEQAMMVMLTGASLGLSPVAALRGVHVIQGKAALDATLVTALVQQHPDCEYWRVAENTNERCTIETKRRGHPAPVSRTWTIDDAKRAGLTNKDTWKSYPAAMLRARCTTDLARGVYGDALFGVYTPEEIESAPRQQEEPAPRTAVVEVVATPRPPVDVEAIIAGFAKLTTADALKAYASEAGRGLTKGTEEHKRVTAAYQARMREIEAGPKDDGPKGGKATTPSGTAHDSTTGEVIETGEHEPAGPSAKAWTLDAWVSHMAAKTNRYEAANSFARHEQELEAAGIHGPASDATVERLKTLGLDESHAVEALAHACDRRDGRKTKAA
jgi:hypothetical protein